MELIYEQTLTITENLVDRYGRAKPSVLLYCMQEAAGQHCKLLGADHSVLSEKNLFWAVTRSRVQITRLPRLGEQIHLKTWPMPTTRVAYPRAAEGFDGEGNSLFKVISIWVIVDMDTRAMVLPGKSGVDVAGTVLGTELKAPGGLPAGTFTNSGFRTVSYSDLDVNGHMNNTRYLDWVCDLLPSAFHRDHPLKAATICYMTEVLEGQQLQLSWSGEETIRVDGSLPQTDVDAGHTRIFSAQLEF